MKLNNCGSRLLFLFLFISSLIKADICIPTFERDSVRAKAIFVGKVVNISGFYTHQNRIKTSFTFQISESFRGVWFETSYVSLIGPINGCCNVGFQLDSTYLVFAFGNTKHSEMLWTNDCSMTGLLSEKLVEYQRLGSPLKHSPNLNELQVIRSKEFKLDSFNLALNQLDVKYTEIYENKRKFRNYCYFLLLLVVILIMIILKYNAKYKVLSK